MSRGTAHQTSGSAATAPGRAPVVRVLEADPALADNLDPTDLAAATRSALARVQTVQPGPWDPAEDPEEHRRDLGLLVLDGLLTRTVVVEDREFSELLGKGDLLRPWQAFDEYASVRSHARWEVIERTDLAILDARFAAVIARWPGLTATMVRRTMERARSLAFYLAVCHMTRVEERLLLVLWHFADRWGRVRPEGIVLSPRLTHHTLGRTVGARRPSVTVALQRLAERGLVSRDDGQYVLHGDPPENLARMRAQTTG
jgi:CRP-like cAMP-binding protein